MCDPRNRILEVRSLGACRLVTPSAELGRWGHLRDCRHVISGSGSGRGLPWAMDVRIQVQSLGGCHPGNSGHVTPCVVTEQEVTLEAVDL